MGRPKLQISKVKLGRAVVGDVHETKRFGKYEIIAILEGKWIQIRFLETGSERAVDYRSFTQGNIKDYFQPSLGGVGFIGNVQGKTRVGGGSSKPIKSYAVWESMIRRCYDEKLHKRLPTYKDCTVCEEWHNFENFHKWFQDNYIEGFELDKDIRVQNNKLYSPETCMFVSPSENCRNTSSNLIAKIVKVSTGDIFEINNLMAFCLKNELKYAIMLKMVSGIQNEALGYRLVKGDGTYFKTKADVLKDLKLSLDELYLGTDREYEIKTIIDLMKARGVSFDD